MTARLCGQPFASCFGPILWVRSSWSAQLDPALVSAAPRQSQWHWCRRRPFRRYHGSAGLGAWSTAPVYPPMFPMQLPFRAVLGHVVCRLPHKHITTILISRRPHTF